MLLPDDERDIWTANRYSYTYDDEKGVITVILSESYEIIYPGDPADPDDSEWVAAEEEEGGDEEVTAEWVPFEKYVYSDFVDVLTSINKVSGDAADASTIYNLQGVAVGRDAKILPAGVYIMKQGGKVQKMLKK